MMNNNNLFACVIITLIIFGAIIMSGCETTKRFNSVPLASQHSVSVTAKCKTGYVVYTLMTDKDVAGAKWVVYLRGKWYPIIHFNEVDGGVETTDYRWAVSQMALDNPNLRFALKTPDGDVNYHTEKTFNMRETIRECRAAHLELNKQSQGVQ